MRNPLFDKLDAYSYFFLRELKEVDDGALVVLVEEARSGREMEDLFVGQTVIHGRRLIESDSQCQLVQIKFQSYVVYQVLSELYGKVDGYDTWEGRLFQTFRRSHFLDYVKEHTAASDNYPGPLQHC